MEIKKSVDGLNNRMKGRKERINKVETRTVEMTQSEQYREKRLNDNNNKQTFRDIWDYNKRSNAWVIEVSEGEENKGRI